MIAAKADENAETETFFSDITFVDQSPNIPVVLSGETVVAFIAAIGTIVTIVISVLGINQ
ncbi:MAG: hypothetical protein LBS85_01695 [Clostridiales Family XIII bacterium]|nr:hypothetical protein [Clostridiales Family XIII bacterium]